MTDFLHQKIDGLIEKLAIIEKSIQSKVFSQKRPAKAKKRGKHGNSEDLAQPAWVAPLMRSLDEVKEFAQLIQNDTHRKPPNAGGESSPTASAIPSEPEGLIAASNNSRIEAANDRTRSPSTTDITEHGPVGNTSQLNQELEDISKTIPNQPSAEPNPHPLFELAGTDMGEALVPKLETIIDRDDFYNEIMVPPPNIDVRMFKAALRINNDDCQYSAEKYTAGPEEEGHCFIRACRWDESLFMWPDFTQQVKIPSIEEARSWLNNVIHSPPKDVIPYYCGHAFSIPFQSPLNPGEEILNNPKLSDIHHPYFHIGADKSAARFHWEDLSCIDSNGHRHGLRSANLVLAGIKIWILIATHHTTKFRDFVNANWPLGPCDYGVSHRDLLISPARLEKEDINFSIHIGHPGKLIVTHQCQYHLVINMGPCIAQSINFKLPRDSLTCPELVLCPDDGLATYAPHLVLSDQLNKRAPEKSKRKIIQPQRSKWHDAVPAHETSQNKRRRIVSPVLKSFEELQSLGDSLANDSLVFKVPQLNKARLPSERVFRLVCAISSREALHLFSSITESWNQRSSILVDPAVENLGAVERRAIMLRNCTRGTHLMKYLSRHHQLYLEKEVDAHRNGRGRSDSSYKNGLLTRTGWTVKNYEYHIAKGKQWRVLCGIHGGLLPLLPFSSSSFGINVQECFDERELDDAHHLLDNQYVRTLSGAGLALQQAIEQSRSVKFAWDGATIDWDTLEEAQVMSYLQAAEDNLVN
ncbi:unnamed protein product [Fusarium graminearum]|nr:unnamed protein product [Fusarium graminearum]